MFEIGDVVEIRLGDLIIKAKVASQLENIQSDRDRVRVIFEDDPYTNPISVSLYSILSKNGEEIDWDHIDESIEEQA